MWVDIPSNLPALYANYMASSLFYLNKNQCTDRQLLYNASLIGLYVFDDAPYTSHPIPPGVRWRKIRQSKGFRILDIFLSCDRKLTYPPNPPRVHVGKGEGMRETIKFAFVHLLLVDLFTLPTLLFHHGLYRPDRSRDFDQWVIRFSTASGLPIPIAVIKLGLMGCYAGTVFCGLQCGWEVLKVLGVGSGLWAEEEWPAIMDRPQWSSSMIDLWGRRYHQVSSI